MRRFAWSRATAVALLTYGASSGVVGRAVWWTPHRRPTPCPFTRLSPRRRVLKVLRYVPTERAGPVLAAMEPTTRCSAHGARDIRLAAADRMDATAVDDPGVSYQLACPQPNRALLSMMGRVGQPTGNVIRSGRSVDRQRCGSTAARHRHRPTAKRSAARTQDRVDGMQRGCSVREWPSRCQRCAGVPVRPGRDRRLGGAPSTSVMPFSVDHSTVMSANAAGTSPALRNQSSWAVSASQ